MTGFWELAGKGQEGATWMYNVLRGAGGFSPESAVTKGMTRALDVYEHTAWLEAAERLVNRTLANVEAAGPVLYYDIRSIDPEYFKPYLLGSWQRSEAKFVDLDIKGFV